MAVILTVILAVIHRGRFRVRTDIIEKEYYATLLLIPFSFHYMVKCRKQANHVGRFGAMTHGWHLDDKRGSTGQ